MSSNNINIANKNYLNQENISISNFRETLKNKKNNILKKHTINNFDKNLSISEDEKKIKILERSYKKSLILLEMIEKQTEKNIYKKYNIEKEIKTISNRSNRKEVQHSLMKKKFLIIPL